MKNFNLNHAILALVIAILALPFLALAQSLGEPKNIEDAFQLLPLLLSAAQNGQWTVFGGIVTLLLVFGLNKWFIPTTLQKAWSPVVSIFLGALVGPAIAASGGANPQAIGMALLSGFTAVGFWSVAGKYFLQKYLPELAKKKAA
ncbi:hypothetical protein ACES2L_06075 [Bdellovibrio bacteriovorus]